MKELKHYLVSNEHIRVFHEDEYEFNAPHNFEVYADKGQAEPYLVGMVDFQKGPIKEFGVNGVTNEALLAMVICRLQHFNQSEFGCRENSIAIEKLEEALLFLKKRTDDRQRRGVEGTHVV